MRANNSLQNRRPRFSVAIQTPAYQRLVNDTLGDPDRARRFVAAITSAVSVNPALQECDAGTVLSAALQGEALNLSPSPQLGQYYLVPYWDKKRGCSVAQFQVGYKGYIQLAERSGQYLDIDAFPVVEGEYKGRDRYTRRPVLEFLEDDGERENRPVVGYYAYFELTNGFRKVLYWSKSQMLSHADRYSQAFHLDSVESADPNKSRVSFADFEAGNFPKEDAWKYSSFWYKDFDAMAGKTMLRQLISKWGITSIDIQKALASDGAVISRDGTPDYLDTPDDEPVTLQEGEKGVPTEADASVGGGGARERAELSPQAEAELSGLCDDEGPVAGVGYADAEESPEELPDGAF
ncbi:recombinase RecT [Pseudoflavonifractor phocaeensis]|uniref:recombinase RecT n=1 Tax=Pseudoflavonifractor phocaeensis TaxID=1870988 RepID=UPI00313AF7A9